MIRYSKNTNNLIIFDLDGVLIDSRSNMKISWNIVRKEFKLAQKFEDYYQYIGLPFEDILNKIGIDDYALIKKIKDHYEFNSSKNIHKVKFYPGVKSTLKFLKKANYKLSILTSKNIRRTKLILNDILYLFNSINTPDLKIKTKPNPDQIFFAIKKAQSNTKNTIFIGDSIYDKMAANSAGVKFLYAAYGYGNIKSDYCLNKFNELKNFV